MSKVNLGGFGYRVEDVDERRAGQKYATTESETAEDGPGLTPK
jgi:hypothetical protein